MSVLRQRLSQRHGSDKAAAAEHAERLPQPLSGAEIVVYETEQARYQWEVWADGVYVASGDPEFHEAMAWKKARERLPQLGLAA